MILVEFITEAEKAELDTTEYKAGSAVFCTDSNKFYLWTGDDWKGVTLS